MRHSTSSATRLRFPINRICSHSALLNRQVFSLTAGRWSWLVISRAEVVRGRMSQTASPSQNLRYRQRCDRTNVLTMKEEMGHWVSHKSCSPDSPSFPTRRRLRNHKQLRRKFTLLNSRTNVKKPTPRPSKDDAQIHPEIPASAHHLRCAASSAEARRREKRRCSSRCGST
jgi:hypothetical protein